MGSVNLKESASTTSSHPLGFWFIFSGELAERCSYYGMRAILTLYMVNKLGFSDERATQVMGLFIAGCYILPLVGGFVADNFLGKYWTIVGFSLPYILGHVILGIETTTFLYVALVLLAMGSGVIKPNISTLMGLTYDQQRPGNHRLRSEAFAMFYGAINIGAAISSFAMPIIRDRYDYFTAFLFPAALMVVAFAFFAAGKPFYAREVIVREKPDWAARRARWTRNGVLAAPLMILADLLRLPVLLFREHPILLRLFAMFGVITFFWAIFDQAPSTWTLFARDHLDRRLFPFEMFKNYPALYNYELAPDQLQALNPVLIIILLPIVTIGWRVLANLGLPLKSTSKMMIGFILTTVCMGIMAAAGYRAGTGTVWVMWQVVAYVIITIAEICISVVGLELAFAAAPKKMKSLVTACWLLPVFFGNMFNVGIAGYYGEMTKGNFFLMLALIMIPVTLAFGLISWWFNRLYRPETEGETL